MILLVHDGYCIIVTGLIIFYPGYYIFHSTSSVSWHPERLIFINLLGIYLKNLTDNHTRASTYAGSARNSNMSLANIKPIQYTQTFTSGLPLPGSL